MTSSQAGNRACSGPTPTSEVPDRSTLRHPGRGPEPTSWSGCQLGTPHHHSPCLVHHSPASQGRLGNSLDIESASHSLSGIMILGSHSCRRGFKAPALWSEPAGCTSRAWIVGGGAGRGVGVVFVNPRPSTDLLPITRGHRQVRKKDGAE